MPLNRSKAPHPVENVHLFLAYMSQSQGVVRRLSYGFRSSLSSLRLSFFILRRKAQATAVYGVAYWNVFGPKWEIWKHVLWSGEETFAQSSFVHSHFWVWKGFTPESLCQYGEARLRGIISNTHFCTQLTATLSPGRIGKASLILSARNDMQIAATSIIVNFHPSEQVSPLFMAGWDFPSISTDCHTPSWRGNISASLSESSSSVVCSFLIQFLSQNGEEI